MAEGGVEGGGLTGALGLGSAFASSFAGGVAVVSVYIYRRDSVRLSWALLLGELHRESRASAAVFFRQTSGSQTVATLGAEGSKQDATQSPPENCSWRSC